VKYLLEFNVCLMSLSLLVQPSFAYLGQHTISALNCTKRGRKTYRQKLQWQAFWR